MFQQFRGDFDGLGGCFAGAKNYFGKILSQRAVHIHLRKTQIRHGRSLESVENFFARNFSGAKSFQQAVGFGRCHRGTMPHAAAAVTREN